MTTNKIPLWEVYETIDGWSVFDGSGAECFFDNYFEAKKAREYLIEHKIFGNTLEFTDLEFPWQKD